jgi:hypothetical protein
MKENTSNNQEQDKGFKSFAATQMLLWIVVAIAVIAGLMFVLEFFESPETRQVATSKIGLHESGVVTSAEQEHGSQALDSHQTDSVHTENTRETHEAKTIHSPPAVTSHTTPERQVQPSAHDAEPSTGHASTQRSSTTHPLRSVQPSSTGKTMPTHAAAPAQERHVAIPVQAVQEGHGAAPHGAGEAHKETFPVVGMAFVNAVIQPMDYELNQRFYGWRPNDIVDVTDNINNFQLGVLEVTRRSAVILAERISRTGSAASFDKNLETAMNWFMIKADRYWFPAAETKYRAGLDELRIYFNKLKEGKAAFYTRTDNLIPLLASYQNLLGSCDENLIKMKEEDGSPVSTFKADDYFFYAKGVASAMLTILEAIQHDFNIMVSREGGMEVLAHAIESCHHAVEIDPWIILNSNPSSIFANHRSNMAAPISHARFYLGVLIKALST